jgi:hypothetical protein
MEIGPVIEIQIKTLSMLRKTVLYLGTGPKRRNLARPKLGGNLDKA